MNNLLKILLVFLGAYFILFTFYNLNWGAPYFFHPDERNIASSVSQLDIAKNMNPHFYAYGQLPIYLTYFIGIFMNFIKGFSLNTIVSFENSILIGRTISAVLTLALVALLVKLTLEIKERKSALIVFLLSTTSVAFFQFSHFATFEIWLSFLYVLIACLLIKFNDTKKLSYYILACTIFGITCGLKLSSAVFILVPLYSTATYLITVKKKQQKIKDGGKMLITLALTSIVGYLLASPFNFLDPQSFLNSMKYESAVAQGTLEVFYTGAFFNQIPLIYQYQKVFPFLINPLITIISIPSIIFISAKFAKSRNNHLGIILISFFVLLLSGSFLFVKWTRYVIPSIPFLYIIISIFISDTFKKNKHFIFAGLIIALIGLVFSFSYLKTVRLSVDSRLSALEYALKNIPRSSTILSEVYDLGIIPFNPFYNSISLFNFYELDKNPQQITQLSTALESDYFIMPSQRIYEPRITHPTKFPVGYNFYSNLFSGANGFQLVYKTPCDIYCKITYFSDPVFGVEQTANVFDRPTLFIFKKNK